MQCDNNITKLTVKCGKEGKWSKVDRECPRRVVFCHKTDLPEIPNSELHHARRAKFSGGHAVTYSCQNVDTNMLIKININKVKHLISLLSLVLLPFGFYRPQHVRKMGLGHLWQIAPSCLNVEKPSSRSFLRSSVLTSLVTMDTVVVWYTKGILIPTGSSSLWMGVMFAFHSLDPPLVLKKLKEKHVMIILKQYNGKIKKNVKWP